MARFVFTRKADDMYLLRSTETTFSAKLLFVVLTLMVISPKVLAEDSKLAGAWFVVEGNRRITFEGHQEEGPLSPGNQDQPYLVIKPDGSFYKIQGFEASYLDHLHAKGDRMQVPGRKIGHVEVERSRYTPDSSELRVRFQAQEEELTYVLSYQAELMPDGRLSFRHVIPYMGMGEEVVTATLKRIEGKRPWDPPGLTLELGGHTGGVESVAFSPDGRYVLSGGGDKTVRLWDAETGEEIHRLVGHQRRISSVAFSADGSLAVSGSYEPMWNEPGDEYSVRIWDLQTGQQLRQIEAYGYVTDVAFSPDGRYILAGGYVLDRDVKRYLAQGVPTLRLWNSKTGALAKEFFDRSVVLQVAFLPDERYVLSAFNRSTTHQPLCISDTQTGLRIRCFGGRRTQIQSMCVSPDSRRLLTASQDGFIHEWDLETGEEVRRLRVDSLFAWGAVYLPDGRRILTSGADKTIRLWDLETEVEIQRFQGHRNTTKGLAVSPDGRRAVSGSLDGTIRLWKLPE